MTAIAPGDARRAGDPDDGARPTALLPFAAAAPDLALLAGPDRDRRRRRPVHHHPPQLRRLRPPDTRRARRLSLLGIGGAIVAILIQPTVGSISDYAVTPLGPAQAVHRVRVAARRRVPARASRPRNTLLALGAFVILLSFSTNIARGPFQGYVPDLVAEPQVGLASALVGMMQILGNVTGFVLVSPRGDRRQHAARAVRGRDRRARHDARASSCGSARGMPPKPREGRSWARDRRARRGAPTSSRSGRTSGSLARACSS